jgi:hypothetical protein
MAGLNGVGTVARRRRRVHPALAPAAAGTRGKLAHRLSMQLK